MNNLLHYLLLVVFSAVFFCLDASPQNPNDFAKMTEVLAAPPNAAALGKYGGIDVSLNSGMMTKSISLYTIKSSQLEVPLSIVYSSGGFKVSESPSRLGMGWTMNIGGVITKTVVGLDDDSHLRINPPAVIQQNAVSYDFLSKAGESSSFDAEPDVYNFNFNGYTGKFVYDDNNQVIFLPANNLKIERYIGGYHFKVTTPDGLMYYFGGLGAVEQNKKSSSCGKSFSIWTPTAFYLAKIISPYGQEINFFYSPVLYDYVGAADESSYVDGITNPGMPHCGDGSGGCPAFASQSRLCQYTYSVQGVVLKKISCSQIGTADIEYTYQGNSSDSLYKRIVVRDYNGDVKKIFEFNYKRVVNTFFANQLQNATTRDFLESLSEKSTDGTLVYDYKFYYNSPQELPVLNSFAADYWGYFNGKLNYGLIQKPFDFSTQFQFPGATAVRSPDFQFARKGLLCKIEYPTGGYDTVVYEGNDGQGTRFIPPPLSSVSSSVTGTGIMTPATASANPILINYAQDAKLEYSIIDNSGNGSFDPLHNKGTVILTDATNNQDIFTRVSAPDNILHAEVVYPSVGHSYRLTVIANGNVVTTNATLHYRPGSSTTANNIILGGVRVKTVSSYAGFGSTPVKTNYYYAALDSLNLSSGGFEPEPYYLKSFFSRYPCYTQTNPAQCLVYYCSHSGIFSFPQNNITLYPGAASYQTVVEGFGDNFANGAIEHTYTSRSDASAENLMAQFGGDLMPGTTPLNNSYYNGKELRKIVFKKSGTQLIPIEKTEYTYKIDTSKSKDVVGCAVNKRYPYCAGYPSNPTVDMINAFNAMRYYHQSRWIYVDSIKQTKYADDGTIMTSYVKTYFDNPIHMLPTRTETRTSTNDVVLSQTSYSADFGTLIGTDNLTQGIKILNNKNILNAEIERTVFKKDGTGNNQRLLSSKLLSYNPFARIDTIFQIEQAVPLTNFNPVHMQSGSIVKDNRYRARIILDAYDNLGNIVQQRQSGNLMTTYLWGYQSLCPVAVITNADSASVAYTSFESDSKGRWNYSGESTVDQTCPTGNKMFVLNQGNNIGISGLNSQASYTVSYWTKNSFPFAINGTVDEPNKGRSVEGWNYFEHRITGQTSTAIVGNGPIDELRLYPFDARMTTYCYDPLIGIIDQCDLNNTIIYYKYNTSGRLRQIRDQEKNIIKTFTYQFKGIH